MILVIIKNRKKKFLNPRIFPNINSVNHKNNLSIAYTNSQPFKKIGISMALDLLYMFHIINLKLIENFILIVKELIFLSHKIFILGLVHILNQKN